MTKSRALFDQWLKRHRLPSTLHPMFQEFCEEQWHQHVTLLESTPRLRPRCRRPSLRCVGTGSRIMRIINPNYIVCFCPRSFCVGFATLGMILLCARDWKARQKTGGKRCWIKFPAHLSRRYSWSFSKSALLPRGTVFLKRKKAVCQKSDYHFVLTVVAQ